MTIAPFLPRRIGHVALGFASLAMPSLAHAGEFCPERPGQTTPTCILDPGQAMIETGLASWTLTKGGGSRADTWVLGDSYGRVGVAPRLELQFGWTPYVHVRTKDRVTGTTDRASGMGDALIGFKYGLTGQEGPVALQGFVTIPTGANAVSDNEWGAGIRLPIAVALSDRIELGITPEVDAAVDGDGNGRHLAYGAAAGIGYPLSETVAVGADVALFRDQDPTGSTTSATSSLSFGWQVNENTQLDIGGVAGLNRNSDDMQVYFGIAHRF